MVALHDKLSDTTRLPPIRFPAVPKRLKSRLKSDHKARQSCGLRRTGVGRPPAQEDSDGERSNAQQQRKEEAQNRQGREEKERAVLPVHSERGGQSVRQEDLTFTLVSCNCARSSRPRVVFDPRPAAPGGQ